MPRVFEGVLSTGGFKLQQIRIKIFSYIKSFTAVLNLDDESNESQKTFYVLSLMLLISVIFLSPDKLAQAYSPIQAENGILERAQAMAKIIKRLVSDLVHL